MGSAAEVGEERLAELRRRMAAIPARGVEAAGRAPVAEEARREALPVPAALENLLPDGGLAKGSVVVYNGAGSLIAGVLAAVTGAGGHAAVVGLPRLGLLAAAEMGARLDRLAAAEMGARLDRLAVVSDPGPDPLEVASVLLDGLDLVVLGLNGLAVPMSRARVLAARARGKNSTLLVTNGSWSGSALHIDTRVAGYSGLGRGCGRLRTVRLDVSVRGRSAQPRSGHLALRPTDGRVEWISTAEPAAAPEPLRLARHA
ncbi:hypothetical protein [Nocardia seriolae]|uniref:Uncharacterized protein n=1 Tax=Nocardia seriolae TaxID=37332 RepID=A0A0B8N0X0_9NOCA|nr:hypothetical protein [Nocardia seriolae]MTJ61071.1 hypothetical protein [Nocardia seriolae]MTJ70468.1 hypothetical protein [Nocardia seriolae]MTJ90797.1 hypothetical protein [Nocardia seriolae]MTK39050.1 hypothetical protein [Nocardia seriolae]MTK51372.1 hypothetical protein [Nocardia seriolae]